jgi:indolepyruvate decarboxylase
MTTVKEYLITRLAELGGTQIFGVPGNYNAEFLLAAQHSGKLSWVGTTNELEAGYAADAYARLTRRIGICCVTYGVGSFSLLNAFAGSHVEFLPVVLINGSAPEAKAQQLVNQGVLFAHAIDTVRTDERVFRQITDPVRQPGDPILTAVIKDPFEAPAQIDMVLQGCMTTGRPVYLEILQNLWGQSCADPKGKLRPAADAVPQAEQEVAARAAVESVLQHLRNAESPVLWGGELLQRLGLEDEFQGLIDGLGVPYTTTLMAKGLVSETANVRRFIGVYDSVFAPAAIKKVVEGSDCLIGLGTILSDFYGVIAEAARDRLIVAGRRSVRVMRDVYMNVPLDRFARELRAAILRGGKPKRTYVAPAGFEDLLASRAAKPSALSAGLAGTEDPLITWDSFFSRMQSWANASMHAKERVFLVDTSLALFPSAELPVERPGRWVAQTAWLSIGYSVGAALGAGLAVSKSRPVVFVGDGGFQMIPQAFSTLVRQKIPAILFVFNNGVYGIEQYLVDKQVLPPNEQFFPNPGAEASFFDILPRWDYVKLAEAFGGVGYAVRTHAQLEAALEGLAGLREQPGLVAVELDPHNLPEAIRITFPSLRQDVAIMAELLPDGNTLALAGFN